MSGELNNITINVTADEIAINETEFGGKIFIEALQEVLGEPRVHKFNPDKNYLEFLEKKYGKDNLHLITYTWDELGIFCYSRGGKLLDSLGVVLDRSRKTAPQTPKSVFSGTFTIEGAEWLSAVKSGKNVCGQHYIKEIGAYSVFAEYAYEKRNKPDKSEDDFTLLEISLEKV